MKKYNNLIFAGTFDHLHVGHKKMLDRAFSIAEKVSIGITTKKLYQTKPLANLIFTEAVRKKAVEQYLQERNWLKRAKFSKLADIYGPSINPNSFDSILVTKETEKNGKKVNLERQKRGLPPLELVVVPFILADDGKPVTSERIRMGEINREGHNFQFLISNVERKQLTLPEGMREELRKPLGKVIKSQFPNSPSASSGSRATSRDNNQINLNFQIPNKKEIQATAKKIVQSLNQLKIAPPIVISVGDIITMSLLREKFMPDVIIVDLKSRRQPIEKDAYSKLLQLDIGRSKAVKEFMVNQASTINFQAAEKIKLSLKNFIYKEEKTLMQVEGEEDLLALPAILFAPLHSIVLYGQWNLGVIMVEVTEEKKKKVIKILKKFLI